MTVPDCYCVDLKAVLLMSPGCCEHWRSVQDPASLDPGQESILRCAIVSICTRYSCTCCKGGSLVPKAPLKHCHEARCCSKSSFCHCANCCRACVQRCQLGPNAAGGRERRTWKASTISMVTDCKTGIMMWPNLKP